MTKLVGNCSHILNWDDFVSTLGPGITKFGDPWKWVNPDSDPNFTVTPDMENYVNETAGRLGEFNYSSTLWHIYRPDEHIPSDTVNTIAKFLNVTPTMSNAYRVEPGCNCPIHIDPQDKTNSNWGKLKRYTWQINKPVVGQVLIVGNDALHMTNACDVYEWDSVDEIHGATNCGSETAYYFLLEGVPND
jgi:hypothetical protein